MPSSDTELVLTRGNRSAVFTRTDEGWTPGWFLEDGRPMLRFKDHEWLSIGPVKPRFARQVEIRNLWYRFSGEAHVGQTLVNWFVIITWDRRGEGFEIQASFKPTRPIELLEAGTSFETPYEYDGSETVTTTIGMNPVSQWKGAERITPPIWGNPAWIYARPQSVRMTAPCNTPYLCQAVTNAGAIRDRFVTIVADWNHCSFKDVFATPTRDVQISPPSPFGNKADLRGYKYLVGALNWSSSFAKDPNVLFDEHGHTQILALDAMFCKAWERASAMDPPYDGQNPAFDRASARNVTWRSATTWLRDVFCSDKPTDGLYRPGEGICTYAIGTRPKGGNSDYSMHWWPQWTGPLHYRALLTADRELEATCDKLDHVYAGIHKQNSFQSIGATITILPAIWWIHSAGRNGVLQDAFAPTLQSILQQSVSENGKPRAMDYGAQASIAETLLLGSEIYRSIAMREQALVLLGEMAVRLDTKFWEFNVGPAGSLWHGGQIRSLGHGHAIVANLLAHRLTGDPRFLTYAHRFSRYLLSISYATHNSSLDPDFDLRGWCNGSNAGRDQIAEAPPWETQNGLLCISSLMDDLDLESGFYDALWFISRTGLAQFPAARTMKRVLDRAYRPQYVARESIATERDYYDILPYLAYENPYDQTLLASYQGTDCLLGEFVYGSGLASAADKRLGVIVPRAALMDLRELSERVVHVWNPLEIPVSTTVTAAWPDGTSTTAPIEIGARQCAKIRLKR